MIPVAHFNNEDLPEMINGKQGDPIEDHPFDQTFNIKNIMKSFLAIGCTLFTRQALKHKNNWHMVGDGGASAEMEGAWKEMQNCYAGLKPVVKNCGINYFVFNSQIPFYKKITLLHFRTNKRIKDIFTLAGLCGVEYLKTVFSVLALGR